MSHWCSSYCGLTVFLKLEKQGDMVFRYNNVYAELLHDQYQLMCTLSKFIAFRVDPFSEGVLVCRKAIRNAQKVVSLEQKNLPGELLSGHFQQITFWNNFLFFSPKEQDMTFNTNCLLRKQFAWNVKSCCFGKNKKKYHLFVVCQKCPENGKG